MTLTVLIIALFVLGYLCIALESVLEINKAAIALLMCVGCWTLLMVGVQGFFPEVADGVGYVSSRIQHHLGDAGETLFFLMGAMTIVEIVDSNGGFNFVRDAIKTRSKRKLMWRVAFMTFFLSALLDNMTTAIVMVALLLCSAAVMMIIPIANRITRPLELLTQAAQKIALGDLNVELPRPGNDEVGILSRSFEVTVSSLRQYVENMNDMAFTDPLTHVKNKTAYNRAILALHEDMARGPVKFGLVMFDLNNLKHINDTYGHEHGDEYIINSCRLICHVFKHSPVFRIGGDEFVALLEGSDLDECDARVAELDAAVEATASADKPWQRLSIAKGTAYSTPGDTAPEDVFVRADRAMYANKRRMKEAPTVK